MKKEESANLAKTNVTAAFLLHSIATIGKSGQTMSTLALACWQKKGPAPSVDNVRSLEYELKCQHRKDQKESHALLHAGFLNWADSETKLNST